MATLGHHTPEPSMFDVKSNKMARLKNIISSPLTLNVSSNREEMSFEFVNVSKVDNFSAIILS